jgi:hypothetical protein
LPDRSKVLPHLPLESKLLRDHRFHSLIAALQRHSPTLEI